MVVKTALYVLSIRLSTEKNSGKKHFFDHFLTLSQKKMAFCERFASGVVKNQLYMYIRTF